MVRRQGLHASATLQSRPQPAMLLTVLTLALYVHKAHTVARTGAIPALTSYETFGVH
jgi:hypothetical protein